MMGSRITEDMKVTKRGEQDISIKDTPYQHLNGLVEELCTAARTEAIAGTKSTNRCLHEIDRRLTRTSQNKLGPEQAGILRRVQMGGAMAKAEAY